MTKFLAIIKSISTALIFISIYGIIVLAFYQPKNFSPLITYSSMFILVLIFILLLILYAGKYEQIRIGKIFELNKIIKDTKEQNTKLEQKNSELLNQLLNVSTTVCCHQNQSTLNFNGLDIEQLRNLLQVQAVSDEEKQKSEKAKEEDVLNTEKSLSRIEREQKWNYFKDAEKTLLSYESKNRTNFIYEAKINDIIDVIDPISNDIKINFDGYYKTENSEVFIEVKAGTSPIIFRDKLYLMLNRIYLYSKAKNNNSFLKVMIIDSDEDIERSHMHIEKLKYWFSKAIDNGLLKIEVYNKSQIEQMKKDIDNQLKLDI
ncbi:MAG: hypothetical protein ACLUQJ_00390 [Alphaproteobacteria bacterium]